MPPRGSRAAAGSWGEPRAQAAALRSPWPRHRRPRRPRAAHRLRGTARASPARRRAAAWAWPSTARRPIRARTPAGRQGRRSRTRRRRRAGRPRPREARLPSRPPLPGRPASPSRRSAAGRRRSGFRWGWAARGRRRSPASRRTRSRRTPPAGLRAAARFPRPALAVAQQHASLAHRFRADRIAASRVAGVERDPEQVAGEVERRRRVVFPEPGLAAPQPHLFADLVPDVADRVGACGRGPGDGAQSRRLDPLTGAEEAFRQPTLAGLVARDRAVVADGERFAGERIRRAPPAAARSRAAGGGRERATASACLLRACGSGGRAGPRHPATLPSGRRMRRRSALRGLLRRWRPRRGPARA